MLFVVLAVLLAGAHRAATTTTSITPPSASDGQHRAARRGRTADARAARPRGDLAARGTTPSPRRTSGSQGPARLDLRQRRRPARRGPLDALRRRGGAARPRATRPSSARVPGAATVQLTYRYDGFDTAPARLETAVTFVPTGDGVRIASFGGADERTPLWLVEPAQRRTHAADAAGGRRRPRPGATRAWWPRAVRQVRRVLPDWNGPPAVVEVPASRGRAGRGPATRSPASTTTSRPSPPPPTARWRRMRPVRVFVNPARLRQAQASAAPRW